MPDVKVVAKKQHFFNLSWLPFFLLLSSAAVAKPITQQIVLRMGIHNFPPDFVVSADGNSCGGPGLELTKRIFAAAQVTLEAVCVAPARMYLLLESGAVDFSINIKSTKALAVQHEFISPAYSQLQLVMYSHKASSTAPRDNSVALIRGFDYQGQRAALVQRGFVMIDLPDSISASELFLHQRSQHLLTYDGPFRAYVQAKDATLFSQYERQALSSIDTFYVLSGRSRHQQLMRQAIMTYGKQHHCRYLKGCQP
jgi:polar amino acid transport system substrate-binding protein